jgi:hypothetical protein
LNNFAKKILIRNKISEAKIYVLPQIVDPRRFKENINKKEAREKLGLKQDKIIILTSGVFREGNFQAMIKFIRALKLIPKELKEKLILVIIGVSHKKEFIDKIIEEGNKIGLEILYLGAYKKDTLNLYLKSSDLALFISLKNIGSCFNTPIRFMEYLTAGLPIFSVDLPNVKEYIKNDMFLFNIDNEKDISNKLIHVLNKIKEESYERREIAHEQIINYLNFKKILKKIIE